MVYIDTELPADVIPGGWSAWGRTNETPQAYYAEFGSKGPGANAAGRIAWSHQLTAREAARYKPRAFLAGKDHWNPEAAAGKLP